MTHLTTLATGLIPTQPAETPDAAPIEPTPEPTAGLLDSAQLESVWSQNSIGDWALLLALVFVGVIAGRALAYVIRKAHDKLVARGSEARAEVIGGLASPVSLAVLGVGISIGLWNLTLPDGLTQFCKSAMQTIFAVAFFWYLYNLVGLLDVVLRRWTSKTESQLDDQLVPMVRKSVRIFLVIVAGLFILDSIFNADIGAWLAGLGIAGLAVSLAAQDSLKNVFGSLTIFLDQPFIVGERIVFDGFDGIVEEIGFRSTKMRTLTGHLVTIPNANIVNTPVENIARRPSIRRILNVTITYDTPPDKIERAVHIVNEIFQLDSIREPIHGPNPEAEDYIPPRVYFNDLKADALNLFVIYWYRPPAYWDYLEHAQRFNLELIRRFEAEGIDFAFPTQTLYLAGDEKRPLNLGGPTPGV